MWSVWITVLLWWILWSKWVSVVWPGGSQLCLAAPSASSRRGRLSRPAAPKAASESERDCPAPPRRARLREASETVPHCRGERGRREVSSHPSNSQLKVIAKETLLLRADRRKLRQTRLGGSKPQDCVSVDQFLLGSFLRWEITKGCSVYIGWSNEKS